LLREWQLHRRGRDVPERDELRSRELRRMRRALAALLHGQHLHRRGRDLLGRRLYAMWRRGGTVLRKPMHRGENGLPRRLSGLRNARWTMLRRQHVRFGVLRYGGSNLPRDGHHLHARRQMPRLGAMRGMRRTGSTLLRGRHLQHGLLRHDVIDEDLRRYRAALRDGQGLHWSQRVHFMRRQWRSVLCE
jgi:hypothetical protein